MQWTLPRLTRKILLLPPPPPPQALARSSVHWMPPRITRESQGAHRPSFSFSSLCRCLRAPFLCVLVSECQGGLGGRKGSCDDFFVGLVHDFVYDSLYFARERESARANTHTHRLTRAREKRERSQTSTHKQGETDKQSQREREREITHTHA